MSPLRFDPDSPHRPATRRGITLIELMLVVGVMGIVIGIAGPKTSMIIRHSRVNRAAAVIASDLQNAFAVAARQRQPVRIQADPGTRSYQFTDRATGKVLRTRVFYGDASDYKLTSLAFNPATVDVFPSGVSSNPVTVELANGDYSRRITASTAGFVRLAPR